MGWREVDRDAKHVTWKCTHCGALAVTGFQAYQGQIPVPHGKCGKCRT